MQWHRFGTQCPASPVTGEASPSVPKARQERAGHPSCPTGISSSRPGSEAQGGLQDYLGGQGQGSLVLRSCYPWYQLDTFTSTTSTCSILVAGDITPQTDALPGLSASVSGQGGGRFQAANPPQLGLVPVTSAKPPLSCCHSPIVTQRLKANAHTSHSLPCLITQHLALSSLLLLSQADLFLANPDCCGLKTS